MLHRHPILGLVTLAYLGVVGWLTLGPQPLDDNGRGALLRVIRYLQTFEGTGWITYSLIEFSANIAMFLPVGVLFVLLLGRRLWWLAIVLCIVLTLGIEVAQEFLRDRISDPRDIIANSLGGLIGVLSALVITGPKAKRIRLAAELAAVRRENAELRARVQ
ncbi:MAG: VanZ family protein [Homoserinimonas sp.]|jgi:glycopeptide antibiotics resistance protein|nr:VanZ family protein [Homoserinimonas sp.]